ncbi:leucine-rich repeat-containing protein 15-like [Chironomus tepperi]|uniref:leucine-rich repeat-containing protein 15-like n=1 Tax=Chironomus tepperi TaxID=113505 RepID=UPI00391F74CB
MEIKVLLVLFAFIGSCVSQRVRCDYDLMTLNDRQHYTCFMSIDNPNGWNNFTQVEGFHYPGMNNVFVTAIIRNTTGSSTINIPDVICQQFPHVTYIDYSYLELQGIGENVFRGCRNLDWLRLYNNRIPQLPENVFFYNRHLRYIDLEGNALTTLPENTFVNQLALETLDLSNNPLTNFPNGVFRNLFNLRDLHFRGANFTAINTIWFQNLFNLLDLDFSFNQNLQSVPADAFYNLVSLETLYLARTSISTFNQLWFSNSKHLKHLFMYGNQLTSIPAQAFLSSSELLTVDFGGNRIRDIAPSSFDNLPDLVVLSLESNAITTVHPRWFENKPALTSIYFDFNQISSLPVGTFASVNALTELGLWNNRIRTINRNSFGDLSNLVSLDLDGNGINSVDERFLRESTNLYYFYFISNACANIWFFDFAGNLDANIRTLSTCIRNFGFTTERTTEAGSGYSFSQGYLPGVHVEVNTEVEASIALTPFNVVWNPMVEIVFNNDTVRIIRNQETQVAIVPNRGSFTPGAGNRFRVSWFRQVIAVFEGNDPFPFISYTMEDWVPIGWVGLRSQQSRAFWFLEPIEIPQAD